MSTETVTRAEVLEAEIRRRMAVAAGIKPRGWNGRAAKDAALRDVDAKLDEWLAINA